MIEFAQPIALWTALSIGLPIIAHMAFRQVTEKYFFPSLRFIKPSQIPRTGKRTPSDIFLLLLRILLFLTISALLADPYWKPETVMDSNKGKSEIVLAVDLSPSMKGWGGIDEAKNKALSILETSEDEVGLVLFGNSIVEQFEVGTEKNVLVTKLKNITHEWKKGNPQFMLDRVEKMFSNKATSRKLIVISDFQQSDWQTTEMNFYDSDISYELIKVGQRNFRDGRRQDNVSIVEAKAVPAGPGKIRIWTVVKNWDDINKTVELDLIAGNQIENTKSVSLLPYGSSQAQFVVEEGRFVEAKVVLSNKDEFELDNNRSIWLKAPPAKSFGFWMPEQEDDETDEEKAFLKTAVLSAGDNGWNRWEWQQDKADALRLGDDEVKIDFLMILGMGRWFEEEQLFAFFNHFIESGGVAIITPGEPFSSAISALKEGLEFDYSFIRVAGGALRNRDPFRIGALPENSILSEVFDGKAARDLYLSAIHQFGILKGNKDNENNPEIPMFDREGRPLAIVKSTPGKGLYVFLPFRMNTTWTDLPLRNSFLPLLMELIQKKDFFQKENRWPILQPGDMLNGKDMNFNAEVPGAFRFEDQWVEVVLSSFESVPECLSMVELEDNLGESLPTSVSSSSILQKSEENKNPLWVWFALFAVSLLIIEMIWSFPKTTTTNKDSAHA